MTTGTVLLVIDDEGVATVFTEALTEAGYNAERASSPQQALSLLSSPAGAFCLILSEPFTQPSDDPYHWLDQIHAGSTVPVVICTGWPQARFGDYEARGYAGFLPQPVDLDDLVGLAETLCGEAAGAADLTAGQGR